ncbi:hypothetical protein BUALT_Bualt14G0075000 [Buddleja alternifolia]|uniref:CCHC-type domain-containing protein n=1 Tax=Buddleja alternifolia TaxID=168488 RepID=A0AAV6WP36_9LAMI|nr:hypothetical protein BUALT_Bualt14G0075000 [Buddleja alternifolia]
MLPNGAKLSENLYKTKKQLSKLGLGYEKIDACVNNFILYYKENKDRRECPFCCLPRYKPGKSGSRKQVPFKVLRFLPLIPRLQRLYASSYTCEHMSWHARNHSEDDMAHPSHGEAWRHFDRTHLSFASDPRNVRLGLCTDGFSPFGNSSIPYFCWPVIITVYNLPPWMCMQKPFMFLNMVIPGPKSPEKNIDVFLRPLIDELKTLWTSGVETYDVYNKQNFDMRAALMWTITDFPGSLPDSWDTLVVSVSNSAPNGDLTLQVVKDCLLNEKFRRKEQTFSTEQNALVTEKSNRRGRNKNRGPQHQRDKFREKSKFIGDFKCHYCGGPNHYERDCRKKKRDQKNGNNANKKYDKDTTVVATDGDVVIICDDACVSSSCQETDSIIDSGASYHITPHRDMLTSYMSGNFGRVRMANHDVTEVICMGNINLETDTGCRLILRDVRHIPDIRLNIISTGQLDDDGYVSNFGEGKWKLTKGSLITTKGKKKNSLYLMQAKLSNGEVNAAVNSSSIELWHKRFGHLSQKGMQLLAKKKLLPDINGIELQTCVDCLARKQHRIQFLHIQLGITGDVQDEQNDITDDEPVDDQVPPIQTDDPVPPQRRWLEGQLDKHVHTDDNGANMLTKSLPREKLEICKSEAGLVVPPT